MIREIFLDSATLLPRPKPPPPAALEAMTQRIPDVSPARRHIIKRPRLTRLLDEATARVILLVAPAGYGKTTLAREWLDGAERPYAWYSATAASADVAALSRGIARALSPVAPEAEGRLAARLRVRDTPVDSRVLAELIADEVPEWPEDFWLAIDDYHRIGDDPACAEFVALLIEHCSPRLLVSSRARPSWATARSILYGHFLELGKSLLALTSDEGAAVLAGYDLTSAPGFLTLTEGWPAVVGLAAITGHVDLPEGALPDPLYEYIARELFQTVSDTTRHWLPRLAVSDRPSKAVAAAVAGDAAAGVVAEAVALELCTIVEGVLDLHPLFLQFLRRELGKVDVETVQELARTAAEVHLASGDATEAFSVAARAGLPSVMIQVVESALDSVVEEGRISTLSHWLERARQNTQHPSLDVAEAEVAFVQGEFERAEVLACRGLRLFPEHHPLMPRALLRAGYAAYFQQSEDAALTYFHRAAEESLAQEELVEALWGQFLCLVLTDVPRAESVLAELECLPVANEDEHLVRVTQGRLELAHRSGGIDEALALGERTRHLLQFVESHMRRTGFLNSLASALNSAARFREAVEVAAAEIEEARRFRLNFALPHAHTARASAYLGLARFQEASSELVRARAATEALDEHSKANAACVEARIALARQTSNLALEILMQEPSRDLGKDMLAEYLATRALALAASGEPRGALTTADEAEAVAAFGEPLVLSASARLGAQTQVKSDCAVEAVLLLEHVTHTGQKAALLAACRAMPHLFPIVIQASSDTARFLLATAHDRRLAAGAGMDVPVHPKKPTQLLTRREEEVLALIASGMRNREIARALFIEEVTAKVHVRNILRKLNVRTRTEAALYFHRRDGNGL